MTGPEFGLGNAAIFINSAKFDALLPELQQILLEEGQKMEQIGYDILLEATAASDATMKKNGVEVFELSEGLSSKLADIYNAATLETSSVTSLLVGESGNARLFRGFAG
jgi:TRAP-type C4-dicarboxylate transport system substrate-binding protein